MNKLYSDDYFFTVNKLDDRFYCSENVVKIAKELIGKILVTNFNDDVTAVRITETEAYNGIIDKASHAYNGRRTARTEIMYAKGGAAYVYLCYGIHHLFNVVTNIKDIPHAVLIRAGEPLYGIDKMLKRSNKNVVSAAIARGPGNLSRALGITTKNSGENLSGNTIFIADDGFKIASKNIIASPRIGVDYAKEDALLPYRFYIKDSEYVSGNNKL